MRITWLDINSSYSHSSMAFPAIEAESYRHNIDIDWSVVKGTIKSDINEIVCQVAESEPQIVAYTSWLFTCEILEKILPRIKSLLPNVKIIGGGPEYMGNNEEYLRKNDYIDYVVRGEGEEVFYQILQQLNNNELEPKADGLCYINSNQDYVDMGKAAIKEYCNIKNPEDSDYFSWDKPFVQVETSRGCFNSCAFCVSGKDRPIRSQRLEQIEARITKIRENGVKDIRILDRTFNHNPEYAVKLLDIFAKQPNMNFHIEIHPALLNSEVKNKIASLPKGVLHIEAGVQSLDNNVLKIAKRAGSAEKCIVGIKMLKTLDNIEVHTDLIAGLPGYALSQIYSDVVTLAKIEVEEIQLESLKLLKGTEMRARATELGIKYSPVTPYEVLATNEINAKELREAMTLSKIVDIYYNKEGWRELFQKIICSDSKYLKQFCTQSIEKQQFVQPLSRENQGVVLYEFLTINAPQFIGEFKIAWVKNGLSLKKDIINAITLSNFEPGSVDAIIEGEWREGMRIYIVEECEFGYIFGFDRGVKHSIPIYIAKRAKKPNSH